MKHHIGDIMYLMKRDLYTRKKIKSILVLGCSVSLIVILFISAVGIYFMKPLLGFIIANIPILNEILFTHLRNVVLPYLQEDLVGMFSGLINNTNVDELRNLVNAYFEQLNSAKNISYDSFINFTNNLKGVLFDGKITQTELDLLRKFVGN